MLLIIWNSGRLDSPNSSFDHPSSIKKTIWSISTRVLLLTGDIGRRRSKLSKENISPVHLSSGSVRVGWMAVLLAVFSVLHVGSLGLLGDWSRHYPKILLWLASLSQNRDDGSSGPPSLEGFKVKRDVRWCLLFLVDCCWQIHVKRPEDVENLRDKGHLWVQK